MKHALTLSIADPRSHALNHGRPIRSLNLFCVSSSFAVCQAKPCNATPWCCLGSSSCLSLSCLQNATGAHPVGTGSLVVETDCSLFEAGDTQANVAGLKADLLELCIVLMRGKRANLN